MVIFSDSVKVKIEKGSEGDLSYTRLFYFLSSVTKRYCFKMYLCLRYYRKCTNDVKDL